MHRYKSNKQALIIAVLIILLCLTSLSGATLALFTNDPSDGTIGIITTAGEIKVDIVDTSPEQNSLQGEVLQFQTSQEQDSLFFEPGATFVTQGFRIKNDGEISINFHVTVSEAISDKEKFYEAFEIWVTTDPYDRNSGEPSEDFIGHLKAGEISQSTYYLIIKMKESASNDFQGQEYTGIGVTIIAVQGNVDIY